MSNQTQRIATAAIGIPAALAVIWYGGLPLVVLVSVLAVLGTRELFDLAERAEIRPLRLTGLVLAGLAAPVTWVVTSPLGEQLGAVQSFVAALLMPFWLWAPWPFILLLAPVVVLILVLFFRRPTQRPLAVAGVTLLAPIYCAVLPVSLLLIRFAAGPDRSLPAALLVGFPLAVTWLCDSFAMWGGKALGGAKLWPEVSPGKTRSGAVAGVLGGVVAALVYVPLALTPVGRPIPLVQAAIMGLVISMVAQVGDLVESLFKREAGVKDSGTLIPGHGGVLDRIDSLYFVLPVTALLFRALGVL